jgi:hypothetical protein
MFFLPSLSLFSFVGVGSLLGKLGGGTEGSRLCEYRADVRAMVRGTGGLKYIFY